MGLLSEICSFRRAHLGPYGGLSERNFARFARDPANGAMQFAFALAFARASAKILRIFAFFGRLGVGLARLARPFAFYVSHLRAKLWAGFAAQAHF